MSTTQIADNTSYTSSGGQTINAGNGDVITLSGGGNTVTAGDQDTITIWGGDNTLSQHDNGSATIYGGGNNITLYDHDTLTVDGGGNSITLHDASSVTVDDAVTEGAGFAGTVAFNDMISAHYNDTIALNYTLNLGASDHVTVDLASQVSTPNGVLGLVSLLDGLTGGSPDTVSATLVVNDDGSDVVNFAGANGAVTLNATAGDTITTTSSDDTITIGDSASGNSSAATGGACSNGIILNVGATASGTTLNGGLGTDTFSAGSGYDGGIHYIGSMGTYAELFDGEGNCVNYSGLACYVIVNYQTGIGEGYSASGQPLWTDTYTDMEQVKGGQLNGNVLIGSDSYFNELKGGRGQTTYYDGTAGDRIIWGEAGATGLDDGQGTDTAYLGSGTDELYWRNQPNNSKGVSNFGETAYGFNPAQGDDLNFSELADAGFAGVANAFNGSDNNLFDWVDVSLAPNGTDTDVLFDKTGTGQNFQIAVVLKNENLFACYGAGDTTAGAQQVVQDMYNGGNLVLTQPH